MLGVVVQSIGFLSSKLETPIAGDKAFGGLILFMIMFFVGAEAFRLEPASTESGFAPTLQTYGVSNGN